MEVAETLIELGAEENPRNDNGNAKESNATIYITVGFVASILVCAALATCFYVQMKRKSRALRKFHAVELECFEQGNTDGINENLTLDQQADLLPYDKSYEFNRNALKLGKQLGGGAFGVVYEGFAHGILPYEEKTRVAVKMVKRMSNDEVSILHILVEWSIG